MNYKTFLFDVPIAIITVAIGVQLATHYNLATDWRAALSTVAAGTAARLAPEALAMLEFYRRKTLPSDDGAPPSDPHV